jgi:hypothetical protein
VSHLPDRFREIPGVVAVSLVGSRDFRLYHRGEIRTDDVRALGFEGTVVEQGAWLTVEGERVDLLYRDLDAVQHWIDEAEAGRYEVDQVEGYLAGRASYVLVGELAVAEVLAGVLPRPSFPEPLRESAPRRWRASAASSLANAEAAAERHDVVSCAGLLAKAATEAAQARLAEKGEWALNEKGIVRRAELGARVEAILAAPGDRAFELARAVTAMRAALGITRDETVAGP